jgi:hypothetical protein
MAAKELRRERQQEDEDAFEFDLENPFTSPDDEPIARLLIAEAEHSASVPNAASTARRGAAGFIAKVRGSRAVPGSAVGAAPAHHQLPHPRRRGGHHVDRLGQPSRRLVDWKTQVAS